MFTREELEELFATDRGLRTWVTNVAGIDPDTLAAETQIGRAMISVCMNAWLGKVSGWSEDETFGHIMHGLKKILPKNKYERL